MTGKPGDTGATARYQRLRLQRSLMGVGAYTCTLALVAACYLTGQLPAWVLGVYAAAAVLINLIFFALIRSNWNLRLARPDMTLEQTLASIVPGLLVIYHVQDALARAGFLLLALVPMIFGILGLNTRRSLATGLLIYAAYLGVMALLWRLAPERISPVGDGILMAAFLATIIQISLLGGYINALREKLRGRNAALNEALGTIEELVNYDELTGTHNRRYLLAVLQQETERCNRGAATFSIGLFDVDHFKQVNDRYGHLAGDQALAEIAASINANLRSIDTFGRYGGEEFLLIMPQTELDGARTKAERLRESVAGLRFDEGACPAVTISAGVTQYQQGEPIDRTLSRADEALYAAKAAGRDRVVAAEPPPEARTVNVTPR